MKTMKIELCQEKCIDCKNCVKICPMGVYQIIMEKIIVIDLGSCITCMACEAACPVAAIKINE